VYEIGGNKFLLRDQQTCLLLDFGMSYSDRRRFFVEPWLSPRDEIGLIEFGLLPDISGVYRFKQHEPKIDGVVLTHGHSDHSAYISFIDRSIPVYCGETTALILQAQAESRIRNFEFDLDGINFQTFRTGETVQAGSVRIRPCHVDHSIPGAYGLIVETSAGPIAYTGDCRMHGTRPEMTQDFLRLANESQPRLMLCEGTNIAEGVISSEQGVHDEITRIVQQTQRLVISNFSYVDIDRFRTFHEIAKTTGRKLAITMRQAHLLSKLAEDRGLTLPNVHSDPHVTVYKRKKKTYYNWEESILNTAQVVDAKDIASDQARYIAVFTLADLNELLEIKPGAGSNFILSMSEPFNEEQEIEFDRLRNWLDHFGLPMYQSHCSGHIMPAQLREAIAQVKPKQLAAIHTEHPGLFARYVQDLTEVIEPQRNQALQVR
jgi:ribonuclease J